MDSATLTAVIAIALSVGSTILVAINHKKCRTRSSCMGRNAEASIGLDIDNTTPPTSANLL